MPTLPLHQPPHNTTLMGVVEGAARYFGLTDSSPWLYGASGHAFLINVHVELCPSGPYVWQRQGFDRLLPNLGLEMVDRGFFSTESPPEARTAVEQAVREALDEGRPASICNLEHQLITGYDTTGFLLTQPWGPQVPVTPACLSFGSWAELGEEIHLNVFTFERKPPADARAAVLDSFAYAVDLYRHPTNYSFPRYGTGPMAYSHWQAALAEHGGHHGARWNATVWSECRRMAARYLQEVAERIPDLADEVHDLAATYALIAAKLHQLTTKDRPIEEQAAALDRAAGLEAEAIAELELLTLAHRVPADI
jgi:hypothetical protein